MNDKTFLMELRLVDPVKIKQSTIKKILNIIYPNINQLPYSQNDMPFPLSNFDLKYSDGRAIASILYTWIINLVKWNAGHKRFIFDDATLAGGRLMNKELIADKDEDETIEDPFKRINAYGLMKKKDEDMNPAFHHEEDYQSITGKDYFNQGLNNISNQKFQKKSIKSKSYMDTKKSKNKRKAGAKGKKNDEPESKGKYVESKQMVFTDLQMLIPSTKSNEHVPRYVESQEPRNDSDHHDLKPVLQDM